MVAMFLYSFFLVSHSKTLQPTFDGLKEKQKKKHWYVEKGNADMHGLITYKWRTQVDAYVYINKTHCSQIASIIRRNQYVAWLILHVIMHKINQSYWFLIIHIGGCTKSGIFKHKTWHAQIRFSPSETFPLYANNGAEWPCDAGTDVAPVSKQTLQQVQMSNRV